MGDGLSRAAYLIKTREFYVGFPKKFSFYPSGMEEICLEELDALALEAMESPESISAEDGVRRMVYGDGRYLVLGVSGFLNRILEDLSEEYDKFVDLSGTRKSYAFVGFAWDLKAGGVLPEAFPDLAQFALPLKKEILPHWRDSGNSVWAETVNRGVPVPWDFKVAHPAGGACQPGRRLNLDRDCVAVFPYDCVCLLEEAIAEAAKGSAVSLCTELYFCEEEGSRYQNIAARGGAQERRLYPNARIGAECPPPVSETRKGESGTAYAPGQTQGRESADNSQAADIDILEVGLVGRFPATDSSEAALLQLRNLIAAFADEIGAQYLEKETILQTQRKATDRNGRRLWITVGWYYLAVAADMNLEAAGRRLAQLAGRNVRVESFALLPPYNPVCVRIVQNLLQGLSRGARQMGTRLMGRRNAKQEAPATSGKDETEFLRQLQERYGDSGSGRRSRPQGLEEDVFDL